MNGGGWFPFVGGILLILLGFRRVCSYGSGLILHHRIRSRRLFRLWRVLHRGCPIVGRESFCSLGRRSRVGDCDS